MGIIDDIYSGGGAKPVSWEEIGKTIEGEIIGIRSTQQKQFGTELPEVWPDGSAKYTPVLTIQTTENDPDDADDDGKRDVYLRSNAFTAFAKALREAYKRKPEDEDLVGASIKLMFSATERSGKGQPRKLFRCRITPRQVASSAWGEEPKPAAGLARPSAMPPDDSDVPFRARTRHSDAVPHRMRRRSRRVSDPETV